ncbi:hypothetical protein A2U01_0011166, partial [Trifolium medium]|nr:hypothetical protein [Trifolium medium]
YLKLKSSSQYNQTPSNPPEERSILNAEFSGVVCGLIYNYVI